MISPVVDALSHCDIQVTVARHEANAVFMAIGYARVTGKPGVVVVTSGPGLTNTMTAVASAMVDSVPLLVIAGEVQQTAQGKGALQEGSAHHLNLIAAFKPITKHAAEVTQPSAVPSTLLEALNRTTSGRPGPVLLTVPINVSAARTSVPELSCHRVEHFRIEETVARRAALELANSRSTIIFAGSGVRAGNGPNLLIELAERLQTPVMTTPKGKGVFPEDHPLHLGVFGMGGHPSTTKYLERGVEVVLALGTSLGDLQTNSWSRLLIPKRTFIHVDIDGSRIGRAYETQLGVVAPIEDFLAVVNPLLPEQPRQVRTFGIEHHTSPSEAPARGPSGRLSPIQAITELQDILDPDTIYTIDSGEHYFIATHYIQARRPDSFQVMTGLGSMGSSLGAAMGVRMGAPERQTCVVCGDGGFVMMAPELETAAREKLPLVVAVFNDECLSMVRLGHEALFGRSPAFQIDHLEIVGLAESLGCQGIQIESPGAIRSLGLQIANATGPVVLDIRIDPAVVLPKNNRFETLADITQSGK